MHYDEMNSYIFVNGNEIKIIKAKVSEINASPAYLDNISKYFKNTRLDEYVFDLIYVCKGRIYQMLDLLLFI